MDKRISRKFFNDRAEHWDEKARNNDPEKLQRMADRLEIKENSQILDVGTGTGVFLPFIAQKLNGGGKIVCVDYAINMLRKANAKLMQNIHLRYVCAEVETLHMAGGAFDAATCFSAFPHFHNKPQALENLRLLLKPGGVMYICHAASKQTINEIHQSIPDFKDHTIPDDETMRQLLTGAGFSDVIIKDEPDSYLVIARNPA